MLKLSEHDLDPVAAFLAASVALDALAARLSGRGAGPYTLVFQQASEPFSAVTAVRDHPLGNGQTFHYGRRAGAVTDLSSVLKNLMGPPAVSVMTCNLVFMPSFVWPISQPYPPFFDRRLDIVRCALR